MSVPKSLQNFSQIFANRVRAEKGQTFFHFGPFSVCERERLLLRHQQPIKLKSKELDVLLVLIKNRSRLVTKMELLDEVWPNALVTERNLSIHIAGLRKALREDPTPTTYIQTVHGFGYRFVAEVKLIEPSLAKLESIPLLNTKVQNVRGLSIVDTIHATTALTMPEGLHIEASTGLFGAEITVTMPEAYFLESQSNESTMAPRTFRCEGVVIASVRNNGKRGIKLTFPGRYDR
jgi:DNA-binding winged helix-turn-helix (wHTH) protein